MQNLVSAARRALASPRAEALGWIGLGLCLIAVSTLAMTPAEAQAAEDLKAVANRTRGQFGSIADLIGAAAFLAGVGFVVFGIFKFYNYSKNPQDPQNKVGSAVMLVVAGALMIAVPTVAGVGIVSLFGTGTQVTKVNPTGANQLREIK